MFPYLVALFTVPSNLRPHPVIDPRLLEILVCPDTHQPVSEADESLVERVNASITAGSAHCVGGKPTTESIDGGLVRKDGRVLYPIRDEIPIMLVDQAIELDDTTD